MFGEKIINFETKRHRKDGTVIDVSLTISPLKDESGHILGAAAIHRDITDRKRWERELNRINEELRVANEELKILDKVKDEILAVVSHELRSPLATVLGYLDLMLGHKLGKISGEAVQGLTISKRNLMRLTRIVEDLTVFSRLESARSEPTRDFFSLQDMVSLTVAEMKVRSEKERLFVQNRIDRDLPLVLANEELIKRVFANLLSNAEKFSGSDVAIVISAETLSDECIQVAIADNGIGIPPDQREKVFEKFCQLDSSLSRKHAGVGIGLSLVRKILDIYDCPSRIEDHPGGGPRVVFELPRGKVAVNNGG
jgi:signal transduction histidine kinase